MAETCDYRDPASESTPLPLEGIRVFDLTLFMAGPWAAMQLGAMGADVIHVVQRDVAWSSLGAGARPTMNGTSVGYISWNMNKRGLALDLKTPTDLETAYRLIRTCDVFLMNMRSGVAERLGMDYETLSALNPRLVYCAITGWGENGPMQYEPGGDTPIHYGAAFATGTGTPDGEDEINRNFTQMDGSTGNYAAQAILLGLLARQRTGRGQRIHLSMLRAATALQTVRIGEYLYGGYQARRLGSAAQSTAPDRAFHCQDARYAGISVTSEREWHAFCDAIGQPALAKDPRFRTNSDRVEHREALDALLEPVFAAKPLDYWELWMERAGVPISHPIAWGELRHHEQVLANEQIISVDTPAWGRHATGGSSWRFSKTPARWFAAPMPDQHVDEILAELDAAEATSPPSDATPQPSTPLSAPLEGLRVLELCEGIAGPYCAMALGDAGAEVTKVERPEGDRARGWGSDALGTAGAAFLHLNRNKHSIVLDIDKDSGAEAVRRLATEADVILLDAGWSAHPALSYTEIEALNPDAVLVYFTQFGAEGPWAHRPPHGEIPVQLAAEVTASLGRVGEPPVRMATDLGGMYAGIYAVQGICAALFARDRVGGQRIDVSTFGSLLHMRSTIWAAVSRPDEWWGYHIDSYIKPPDYGYRCRDAYIYLSVARASAEQREALYRDLGMDGWVRDDPLWDLFKDDGAGGGGRYSHLVTHIWDRALANFDAAEAIEIVKRHGGWAFPKHDYRSLLASEQVEAVGMLIDVPAADGSPLRMQAPPWEFADTPASVRLHPPALGEHTDAVLGAVPHRGAS